MNPAGSVSLSTHVLDTGLGAPADGVLVVLYRGDMFMAEQRTDDDGRARLGDGLDPGSYRLVFHPPSPFFKRVELMRGEEPVGSGETDGDGRISDLAGDLEAGDYRLIFHPPSPFFRRVELEVSLDDGHYHVPLLVSPYSCASYRGS